MGQERPASWHDRNIRDQGYPEIEWTEHPYADLWQEVAKAVPANSRVVHIGCGCGHLAVILRDHDVTDYLGFDFSPSAIESAQKRAPWAWFVNIDVRNVTFPHADVFLFIDILDNIWDDVEVVNSVPNDSNVIITVPVDDGPSRVAHFPTLEDATKRYRDVMTIENADTFRDQHQVLIGTV